MSKALHILFLFLVWSWSLRATNEIIYTARTATALSGVALFPDSTYEQKSKHSYPEGELFEIIGETSLQHEDDSQNQKFKWYQVKTQDGKIGWVFGDALAVALSEEMVDEELRVYHKRDISLNNGFEKAIIWLAIIEGRDNLHDQDYLNPPYKEFYLVITNERGKSVHLNISGVNAQGRMDLRDLRLYDTTGDDVPEIILQTSSFTANQDLEHRNLEIYSLKAGLLTRVLEERMTLTYQDDLPSPALFKQVEIEEQLVRVAYVDYVPCKNYSVQEPYNEIKAPQERCLEYVTYTHQWDDSARKYRLIYAESRTVIRAKIRQEGTVLRDEPSVIGQRIRQLPRGERVTVIKHFERYAVENNKNKVIPYLYIKLTDGSYGYVLGETVGFSETEHTHVLSSYYQVQPLSKLDWKVENHFLRFIPDNNSQTYFSEK